MTNTDNDKKIRVMHLAGTLKFGGVDEVLHITAKYNLASKYELAFVACESDDGYMGKRIRRLGYEVFGLGISQRIYDIRLIPKVMGIIKRWRPDIIHFYAKPSIWGRIAAKLAGVPIIICNEMDMDWAEYGASPKYLAKVKRKLDFIPDCVIACSKAVREYWDNGKSGKYEIMYLPFDLEKVADLGRQQYDTRFKNGDTPVIGLASRLYPRKGLEYLVMAMPKIIESLPGSRLKIIGTGPLVEELKALSASLKVSENIEFTGFVDDLFGQLQTLDLYVFPSLTEGFPVSIVEAMAVGLPIAASPAGGIPEIVEEGITGRIFKMRDTASLHDTVVKILSDPAKARLMGENGRTKVHQELTPQLYMEQLDTLYTRLLKEKGLIEFSSAY